MSIYLCVTSVAKLFLWLQARQLGRLCIVQRHDPIKSNLILGLAGIRIYKSYSPLVNANTSIVLSLAPTNYLHTAFVEVLAAVLILLQSTSSGLTASSSTICAMDPECKASKNSLKAMSIVGEILTNPRMH